MDLYKHSTNPCILTSKSYMVPRVKVSKGCCVPRSASNPSWEPADSMSFIKVEINIPSVHMGHGVGPCQEFSYSKVGAFHLGSQELSKEAATAQGWAQCPTCHPSHSTLSLCVPSWHSAFPGGVERQLGSLLPRVLCSQGMPGLCRAKAPTVLGVPGKWLKTREEDRPKESDFTCKWFWEFSDSSHHSARLCGNADYPQTWSSGSGSRKNSPPHSNQTCWGKSHRFQTEVPLGRTDRRHGCV